MVAFAQLALALSAIVGTLAAPAAELSQDLPDFEIGGTNLARRQDYTQNYKTGGNVNFQSNTSGYSVTFSGAGDFVVGRGWKTGSDRYLRLLFLYFLPFHHLLTFRPGISPSVVLPQHRLGRFSSLYMAGRPTH